jgi:DNA-binding winged helix-turn-helix (wHTH) protein
MYGNPGGASDMKNEFIFGPFTLDMVNETLLRGRQAIPLRPKTFAVLRQLVERPNRLVTKQQLLESVWPGTFVSDTVIKVCIRELRAAFDDSSIEPRFIQTVHGRGYRFIALPLPSHVA